MIRVRWAMFAVAVLVLSPRHTHAQSKIEELGAPEPPPPQPPIQPPIPSRSPSLSPTGQDQATPPLTDHYPGPVDPTMPPMPPLQANPDATDSGPSKIREGDPTKLAPLTDADRRRLAGNGDLSLIGQSIVAVRIADNTKTDSNTIEYLAGIKLGTILSIELVELVRTRLESAGLFKAVVIYWEPATDREGRAGVRIVISAKDKLSWIIAPTFSYSPPVYGGGLAYAESNAFGRNMKFLAYGTYTTADKMLLLVFLDPHIGKTPLYWQVDALARRDHIIEYATGHLHSPREERATDVDTFGARLMIGVTAARRFKFDARLKIYYDRVNTPTCHNTQTSNGYGTPDVVAAQGGTCIAPAISGWDNSISLQAQYDGRSKVHGIVAGPLARVEWQYGAHWLGNVSDYHLLQLQGLYGFRFFKEHNLLIKAWADVAFNAPFKQEVTAGGVELRGYLYREFRGDTSVRSTIEYIVPLFTVLGLSFRAIAFYDTNLTWFRSLPHQEPGQVRVESRASSYRAFLPDTPSGVVRDSWHNGLGGGIRLYLKGVILPLVGVDLAYGIESRSFQYYVSIGSSLD